MRLCLTTLILLLAGLLVSAAAPIDFTPIGGQRTLDGVIFKQLIFQQDGHAIRYEPPRDWGYSGDAAGLRLNPTDISQAKATVQQVPLAAPQIFDEPTVKQLQQIALAALPPGATDQALIEEEMNPVQIHQQPTYGVTFGYKFLGQEYVANMLFVNLGDTQVRFRAVARKADFEKVWRAFRGSLFGLSWE